MNVKFSLPIALLFSALTYASEINCNTERGELQSALRSVSSGETISVSGTCVGPFTITKSLTLNGRNGAILDGGNRGRDAVRIVGPVRVTLDGLQIVHGTNGIYALSGAQLSISDTHAHDTIKTEY